MLKLGPSGLALHKQSGEHMAEKKIDFVLGVRGLASTWSRPQAQRLVLNL